MSFESNIWTETHAKRNESIEVLEGLRGLWRTVSISWNHTDLNLFEEFRVVIWLYKSELMEERWESMLERMVWENTVESCKVWWGFGFYVNHNCRMLIPQDLWCVHASQAPAARWAPQAEVYWVLSMTLFNPLDWSPPGSSCLEFSMQE